MGDLLHTLSSLVYYLVLFLIFVVAVVALVRFRATPSGLMIGGGLLAMAFMSSCFTIINRLGVFDGADMTVYTLQSGVQSCGAALLWAVIAGGVFLIPKSLETLGKSG